MTAITTKASALAGAKAISQEDAQPPRRSTRTSASEAEAKTRFVSALNKGVDTLLDRCHGRERASAELLTEIADGCSPDEDEIFRTMELFGISLEDATKVMTVSAAFRKAQTSKGGSAVAAIDALTSRLNLADISRRSESARSPSVASTHSTPNTVKMTELVRTESVDSSQTRPSAVAKKGQRPTRAKSHQHHQGRGRKRALAEKTPENSKENVMIEEPKNKAAGAQVTSVFLLVPHKVPLEELLEWVPSKGLVESNGCSWVKSFLGGSHHSLLPP